MIQIKRKVNGSEQVVYTLGDNPSTQSVESYIDILEGSNVRRELMGEHYARIRFSLATPIYLRTGDYIDLTSMGYCRFELTSPYVPKYNPDNAGFDFDITFDAYYKKWANKICMFRPASDVKETEFDLTAKLDTHLETILSNINYWGGVDDSFRYNGQAFTYDIQEGFGEKMVHYTYQNVSIEGALSALAGLYDCEWWVDGGTIFFGKYEHGTAVTFQLGIDDTDNVVGMDSSGSNGTYANRLYVFGSTRNIPSNYREVQGGDTLTGVVQKRLMLPVSSCPNGYIQETVENESQIIEDVLILDDIYPKATLIIKAVDTYTVGTGDEARTYYRLKYKKYNGENPETDFIFKEEYRLDGEELRIVFESGAMNGMDFEVVFNPLRVADETSPDAQVFEIVANEEYGVLLPASTLIPSVGDLFVIYGWDTTKIENMGLVAQAEQELYAAGIEEFSKSKVDSNTYTCTMWGDSETSEYDMGQRITLVNPAFEETNHIRTGFRITGYEKKLDIPYDQPKYIIGKRAFKKKKLSDMIADLNLGGIGTLDKNTYGDMEKVYRDCGEWVKGDAQGVTPSVGYGIYVVDEYDPTAMKIVTHDVWHYGAMWRCLVRQPVVTDEGGVETVTYYEPKWKSPYWQRIAGDSTLKIELSFSSGNLFERGSVDTTIIPRLLIGSEDITDQVAAEYWSWERSCDMPNAERRQADAVWNEGHTGIKTLTLTNADMPEWWSTRNRIRFKAKANVDGDLVTAEAFVQMMPATGQRGIDGNGIEWVFVRTATDTAPTINTSEEAGGGNAPYDGKTYHNDMFQPLSSAGRCTNTAQGGLTKNGYQYEWYIMRTKASPVDGERDWMKYSGTMLLWTKYVESISKESETYRYAVTNASSDHPSESSQSWVSTKQQAIDDYTDEPNSTLPQNAVMWTKTDILWNDNSHTILYSGERNPNDGQAGMSITIASQSVQYAKRDKDHAVSDPSTIPSNEWSNSYPSPLSQGDWIYTKTTVNYQDSQGTAAGSTVTYGASSIGQNGGTGKGVSAVTEHYKASAKNYGESGAPTTPTDGTDWGQSPMPSNPSWGALNPYLWNYEKITYTEGNPTRTTASVIAVWTEDGRGIDSIVNFYKKSNLSTGVGYPASDPDGGGAAHQGGTETGWSATVQVPDAVDQFLWNYERITWIEKDGTYSYTYTDPHVIGHFGKDGENTIRVDLDNEMDSMLYDGAGNKLSSNIVSHAKLFDGIQDKTSDATWSLSASGCTISSNTGSTITVTAVSSADATVTATASYGTGTYVATMSIKKIVNADKYDLDVSPNALSLNTDDGWSASKTITIKVMRTQAGGGTPTAVNPSTYGLAVSATIGTLGSYNSTSKSFTLTVTQAQATDNDNSVIALYKSGDTSKVYDRETVPFNKAENGDNGVSAWVADLDNEMDSIVCGNDQIPIAEQVITTNISLFYGTEEKTPSITSIIRRYGNGSTRTWTSSSTSSYSGVKVQWVDGAITITYGTAAVITDKDTFTIYVKDSVDTSVTRTLVLTVNGIKGDARYNLVPSDNVVSKSTSGTYSPSTITCAYTKYDVAKGAFISSPTGGAIVYTKDGGSTEYPYTIGTTTLTAGGSGNTGFSQSVTFLLKVGTVVVDRETVQVVEDGANGTSPYFADIDNEMDSVPCTYGGVTTASYDKYINVSLWHGSSPETLTKLTPSTAPTNVTLTPDMTNKRIRVQVSSGVQLAVRSDITITVASANSGDKTLHFILNGVRGGSDGTPATIFSLLPSTSSIKKDKSNTLVPASPMTCDVRKVTGNSTPTRATSSDGTLYYKVDGDITSTSTPDISTLTINTGQAAYTSSNKYITFAFFKGTTLLDKERVPIVYDGDDGVSAFTIDIDNDSDQFGTDSTGLTSSEQNKATVVQLFYGTTPQTITKLVAKVYRASAPSTSVGSATATTSETEVSGNVTISSTVVATIKSVFNGTSGTVTLSIPQSKTINDDFIIKVEAFRSLSESRTANFTLKQVKSGEEGVAPDLCNLRPTLAKVSFTKSELSGSTAKTLGCGYTLVTPSGTTNTTTASSVSVNGTTYYIWWRYVDGTYAKFTTGSTIYSTGILPSTTQKGVEFCLSSASSNSDITPENTLDYENVPIIKDGDKGDSWRMIWYRSDATDAEITSIPSGSDYSTSLGSTSIVYRLQKLVNGVWTNNTEYYTAFRVFDESGTIVKGWNSSSKAHGTSVSGTTWIDAAANRSFVGYMLTDAASGTTTDPVDSTKVFMSSTICKVANGTSPYIADIDNEMDSVACDENGKASALTRLYTKISVFYGTTDITKDCTVQLASNDTGGAVRLVTSNTSTSTGTDITNATSMSSTSRFIRVQFAANASVTQRGTVVLTINHATYGGYSLTFTINGVRAGGKGQNAIIYSLVPSCSEVVKKKDNTYVPSGTSKITCSVLKTDGTQVSTEAGYNTSNFLVKYSLNGESETAYTSSGITVETITSNLVFFLYNSAGSVLLDKETIPLVEDGEDGTSPWFADLSNEMDAVSCDKLGYVAEAKSVTTTANLFHGSSKENCKISTVKRNGTTLNNGSATSGVTGVTASWSTTAAQGITLTIAYATTAKISGKDTYTITVTDSAGGNSSSLTLVVNGVQGDVYQLLPNVSEVVFGVDSTTNQWTPSSIGVYCGYTKNVGGTITEYVGTNRANTCKSNASYTEGGTTKYGTAPYNIFYRYQNADSSWTSFYWNKDLTNGTESVANSYTYTAIQFVLTSATGTSSVTEDKVLDRETLPITKAGKQGSAGENATSLSLSADKFYVDNKVNGYVVETGNLFGLSISYLVGGEKKCPVVKFGSTTLGSSNTYLSKNFYIKGVNSSSTTYDFALGFTSQSSDSNRLLLDGGTLTFNLTAQYGSYPVLPFTISLSGISPQLVSITPSYLALASTAADDVDDFYDMAPDEMDDNVWKKEIPKATIEQPYIWKRMVYNYSNGERKTEISLLDDNVTSSLNLDLESAVFEVTPYKKLLKREPLVIHAQMTVDGVLAPLNYVYVGRTHTVGLKFVLVGGRKQSDNSEVTLQNSIVLTNAMTDIGSVVSGDKLISLTIEIQVTPNEYLSKSGSTIYMQEEFEFGLKSTSNRNVYKSFLATATQVNRYNKIDVTKIMRPLKIVASNCATDAATSMKRITVEGVSVGSRFKVKFTYGNTANNVTVIVNNVSSSQFPLYLNGKPVVGTAPSGTATNTWSANTTMEIAFMQNIYKTSSSDPDYIYYAEEFTTTIPLGKQDGFTGEEIRAELYATDPFGGEYPVVGTFNKYVSSGVNCYLSYDDCVESSSYMLKRFSAVSISDNSATQQGYKEAKIYYET